MRLRLEPKKKFDFPVEANNICPDELNNRKPGKISEIPLYKGSTTIEMEDLFEIDINSSDASRNKIIVDGDIPTVKRVGQKMSKGKIQCLGDVSLYVGAFMSGGKIEIKGNTGAWTGQQMSGGELVIEGDSGPYLGGTYRGDWKGITDGKITVKGNVGEEAGEWMNGGSIEIEGNAGPYLGTHMQGGTILVHGDAEERVGAQMEGGKIIVMGGVEKLLPSFKYEEKVENVRVDDTVLEGNFLKFSGSMSEDGKGELYLSEESTDNIRGSKSNGH